MSINSTETLINFKEEGDCDDSTNFKCTSFNFNDEIKEGVTISQILGNVVSTM